VPLDAFTVNLADHDAERFAQIAVTLELDDAHVAEQLKAYMPAIRDSVLMILSHKTSTELLERAGKEKLAREIRRESARAMGFEVEEEEPDAAPAKDGKEAKADKADKAAADDDEDTPKPKKKKKKKPAGEANPIKQVLFANFIIQ
jgi:flagellar protein FliL